MTSVVSPHGKDGQFTGKDPEGFLNCSVLLPPVGLTVKCVVADRNLLKSPLWSLETSARKIATQLLFVGINLP